MRPQATIRASTLRLGLGPVLVAIVLVSLPRPSAAATDALGLTPVDVSPCSTTFGVESAQPSLPTQIPAALTKREAARLAYYSNGYMTVLGPRGWSCRAVVAADGGLAIEVYRPGSTSPNGLPDPQTPANSVYAAADSTGHVPGAQLICGYFPDSQAARGLDASGPLACPTLPKGTKVSPATDDLVSIRGPGRRTGVAIYPQFAQTDSAGAEVSVATCRLPSRNARLCRPILRDYAVRTLPTTRR